MAVQSSFKNMTICLFAICAVCSSLLAGVYALTKEPIDSAARAKNEAAIKEVLPESAVAIEEERTVDFEGASYTYALPYFLAWNHLLRRGTTEFMIRIANETPSGYAPK